MATNLVLVQTGTAIILADTTDHAPAAGNNLGTRTDQIDLTSLATVSYRESAKVDFSAVRARLWEATAVVEFTVAPTAGETIDLWIGFSHSATAATGNPGNLSGADGAYVGYGAASTDADECINQLEFIGSAPLSNDATAQTLHFGLFVPRHRYGSLVLHNGSSQSLIADAVEMSIRLSPIEDQIQADV